MPGIDHGAHVQAPVDEQLGAGAAARVVGHEECDRRGEWFGMPEDRVEGFSPDPELTARCSLREALDEHPATDLRPHLHVGVHPSPVLLAEPSEQASGRVHERTGM